MGGSSHTGGFLHLYLYLCLSLYLSIHTQIKIWWVPQMGVLQTVYTWNSDLEMDDNWGSPILGNLRVYVRVCIYIYIDRQAFLDIPQRGISPINQPFLENLNHVKAIFDLCLLHICGVCPIGIYQHINDIFINTINPPYPLVTVYKNYGKSHFFSWVNELFHYGHFQYQTVSLPEAISLNIPVVSHHYPTIIEPHDLGNLPLHQGTA